MLFVLPEEVVHLCNFMQYKKPTPHDRRAGRVVMLAIQIAAELSRIGVIEPGMIGIMRPLRVAPKRDFEGVQECGFLPDLATAFSPFSGIGLGLRKLSPSMTTR